MTAPEVVDLMAALEESLEPIRRKQLEVGQSVKCQTAPGRRTFEAVILLVRPDGTVDVTDPRNGGRRTLAPELCRRIRRKKSR